MKKLSLKSSVYKKFFELSDIIWENLKTDIWLINIDTNSEKLWEIIYKNHSWGIFEDELLWRLMHYIVLDNINIMWDYLDNSKEVEYLQTTFLWMFEILDISKNKVVFLDISTWKEFDIIWEGEWSESRLSTDFIKGDLLISRLINLSDGWYNMKTMYHITNKDYNNGFEELKVLYKNIFYWIENMLDMEERMNILNQNIKEVNNKWDINYIKRIKSLLLKIIWKKKFKEIEKNLKKIDNKTYNNILDILLNFKIDIKILEEVKWYIYLYIQENIKSPEEEKQELLNARIEIVVSSFFEYLKKENKPIPSDRKMTEKELDDLEKIKANWFSEQNSLFSNKSPIDFLHEVAPDYDISNLILQQISPEEQEFYDVYNKTFTDEQHDIYSEALKNSTSWRYLEAKIWYEKLLKEHSGFFRLKWNYISVYMNYILDKYREYKNSDFVDTLDQKELENDFDFIRNLSFEIENLDNLKKGYKIKWSNDMESLIEDFTYVIWFLVRQKRKEVLDKLITNDDEEELLKKLRDIIPSFDLQEFLNEVRLTNTIFVDIYSKNRIIEWLWYKEDDIWDIFYYLWYKYKKEDDFTDDYIDKLYKNIWVRKIKEDKLTDFNLFVVTNRKQIKSKKSQVRILFNESIEFWNLTKPKNILKNIKNEELKEYFIMAMDILGIVLD